MTNHRDVLIVGAGIFGITAALELHARGHRITVIDPGPIPHPLAASTDISKVVRRSYGTDEDYLALAEQAIKGWEHWNREVFTHDLFHPVGVAYFSRGPMEPGGFEYESFIRMQARGGDPIHLDAAEIARRFPAFGSGLFVDGFLAPEDGYAESGRVVAELAAFARRQGIDLQPNVQARALVRTGGCVRGVLTEDGHELHADHTLVAAGAWTPLLVPEAAPYFRTTGHPIFHLKPAQAELFEPPRFPVWSDDASASGWYGFPLHPSAQVVKIAHHGEGRLLHPAKDQRLVLEEEERMLRAFLRKAIPSLADAPIVYTRLCLYCDTLDQHFWIDRAPRVEGLTIAAGGSGHAFKFAPVLGWLIADAVEDRVNPYRHKFRWRELAPNTEGEERRRYRKGD